MLDPVHDRRVVEAAVEELPPDRCRRVAVAAARRALDGWPERPAVLDATLREALAGPVSAALRAEVLGIADELDDRYLDLYDEAKPGGRTPGWEAVFSRARAAAATACAIDEDPRRAASGALYEASYAIGEDLIPLARGVA
jgi:hypothetical protein